MALSQSEARDLIQANLYPKLRKEREHLNLIDKWYRWEHEGPGLPRRSTREYRELAKRAETPWGNLVVTSVAQTLYVDGYRRADSPENASPWRIWQANGMDARQMPIYRAALAYGLSHMTVLPGKDFKGKEMPVMRGVSPRRMLAVYEDPAQDELPRYALRAEPKRAKGEVYDELTLYDDNQVWRSRIDTSGSSASVPQLHMSHGLGFCPIVRFTNMLDLEGRTPGEVEPYISVFGRIDQSVFDRLVVQRFAAWVVRTVTGMSLSEIANASGETEEQAKLRLQAQDFLVIANPNAKVGSLPASPLDGLISAADADVKALSAVSQTPAHELLGQMANLSAEALAAANASKTAKSDERKMSFGESNELALRIGAVIAGDTAAADDVEAQVRWRDTEIRSLSQAADALGKLATMLQVPFELLWEKIPGWTQRDVERAKSLVKDGGGIEALLRELAAQQKDAPQLLGPDGLPVAS